MLKISDSRNPFTFTAPISWTPNPGKSGKAVTVPKGS